MISKAFLGSQLGRIANLLAEATGHRIIGIRFKFADVPVYSLKKQLDRNLSHADEELTSLVRGLPDDLRVPAGYSVEIELEPKPPRTP